MMNKGVFIAVVKLFSTFAMSMTNSNGRKRKEEENKCERRTTVTAITTTKKRSTQGSRRDKNVFCSHSTHLSRVIFKKIR